MSRLGKVEQYNDHKNAKTVTKISIWELPRAKKQENHYVLKGRCCCKEVNRYKNQGFGASEGKKVRKTITF